MNSVLAEKIKLAALHGIAPPRVSRVFCIFMALPRDKSKRGGCCGGASIYCTKTDKDQRLNLCTKCEMREPPKP